MHSRATDRRSASKCQGKWPDQTLDQAFGLPEVLSVSTSRLSCKRAGKTRTLMPAWDSSGESRVRHRWRRVPRIASEPPHHLYGLFYRFSELPTPLPLFVSTLWSTWPRQGRSSARWSRRAMIPSPLLRRAVVAAVAALAISWPGMVSARAQAQPREGFSRTSPSGSYLAARHAGGQHDVPAAASYYRAALRGDSLR